MSEQKMHVIDLLSVPLTRDKQSVLLPQFQIYAALTNYAIKLMIQKQITSPSKALETLREGFERKFIALTVSSDSREVQSLENARGIFESRFNPHFIERYRELHVTRPDEQDTGPVDWFLTQYLKDVIRSASTEIAHHRRLAATVRTLREKTPFFKPGRMILSAPTVSITETSCIVLAADGEEIPVPFDKRSKNREAVTLAALAAGQRKYGRVRLKWHREGYLDIDIRIVGPALT